jgi:hypothetical protein
MTWRNGLEGWVEADVGAEVLLDGGGRYDWLAGCIASMIASTSFWKEKMVQVVGIRNAIENGVFEGPLWSRCGIEDAHVGVSVGFCWGITVQERGGMGVIFRYF